MLSGKDIETIRRVAYRRDAQNAWQRLRFIAFDMPNADGGFENRLQQLQEITHTSQYLQIARWDKLKNESDLTKRIQHAKQGAGKTGGGLILRLKNSPYKAGDNDFLETKPYEESTAQVTGINPGKTGNMGSLDVMDKDGGQFIIASGFSDEMRRIPPAKGVYIAYKYNGYTETGAEKSGVFIHLGQTADVGAKTHFGRYISALLNLGFFVCHAHVGVDGCHKPPTRRHQDEF